LVRQEFVSLLYKSVNKILNCEWIFFKIKTFSIDNFHWM
jgi:hypothetical protein